MQLFFRSSSGTQVLPEAGGVLGRAEDVTIRLLDDSVSSHHAEFSWDGQKWWIRPLADHNPVYRDGKRLPVAKVPLGDGGTLQFGKLTVTFWVAGHEPKADTSAPAEWQRLRLRDVPSELLTGRPPIVEMDVSKVPTVVLDREAPIASNLPPTLYSTPQMEAKQQQAPPLTGPTPSSTRSLLPITIAGTVSPSTTMPVPEPVVQGRQASAEPSPMVSERAEFSKQTSIVVALLTLLCLLGFGVGYWLLA